MKVKADVIIRWPDGKEHTVGKLDLEPTKDGMKIKGTSRRNTARCFGWAMVKQGLSMMISSRKDEKDD